jgi:hypothetical protein
VSGTTLAWIVAAIIAIAGFAAWVFLAGWSRKERVCYVGPGLLLLLLPARLAIGRF